MKLSKSSIVDPKTPILIVDDSHQYALLLQKMLEHGLGYKDVTMVDNIEKAYELITGEPERFKLLFVDYCFPSGKTGGQLLDSLSEVNLMSDKVAFLITSQPTLDNLKQAITAGAIGVVAKPFDRDELTRQIKKAERSLAVDEGEGF